MWLGLCLGCHTLINNTRILLLSNIQTQLFAISKNDLQFNVK